MARNSSSRIHYDLFPVIRDVSTLLASTLSVIADIMFAVTDGAAAAAAAASGSGSSSGIKASLDCNRPMLALALLIF